MSSNVELKISAVAEIIANQIDICGKRQNVIAQEVGYTNPNVIAMIKQGKTKLPLSKVSAMAESLGLDKGRLMRLTLKEYSPDVLDALEECLAPMVTENERVLLEVWREATEGQDPSIDPQQAKNLSIGFAQFS